VHENSDDPKRCCSTVPSARKPVRSPSEAECYSPGPRDSVSKVICELIRSRLGEYYRSDDAQRQVKGFRLQGGIVVHAVRLTRMPMMVTDATLHGNPIVIANNAFVELPGLALDEIVGQDPTS
jgi:hypothetical protein